MTKRIDKKPFIICFLTVLCILFITSTVILAVFLAIKLPAKKENSIKDDEEIVNSTQANYLADQLLARVNFTADPCGNFYEYACSHWKSDHPLPPDKSNWNAELLVSLSFRSLHCSLFNIGILV